jgi:hypothetical protein
MPIQFKISLLRDVHNLQEKWIGLEAESIPNFMLSWSWIGSWISASKKYFTDDFKEKFFLLEGFMEGKLISLAIIVKHHANRYGFISSDQLLLHKAGFAELDIICQEYNGLLTIAGYLEEASAAAMDFLLHSDESVRILGRWDEFILSSAEPAFADAFMSPDFTREMTSKTNSYNVDLAEIRDRGLSYLGGLSNNTRYQIKRSIRLYDKRGGMRLIFAKNADQAYDFFKEGGGLFKERWNKNDEKSAFDMKPFMGFHRQIIDLAFSRGQIDIIRLTIGEGKDEIYMGMLYNYIHQGQVYFYMNALRYEDNPKLKPGMVAHSMAVQHYLERGFNLYNFMGGDSRYKKNLGKISEMMLSYSYKRSRMMFRAEGALKKLKNILK